MDVATDRSVSSRECRKATRSHAFGSPVPGEGTMPEQPGLRRSLALRTSNSPLNFPFLLQCEVSFLLVRGEKCVDSSVAVFVDAAHLYLFLSNEQRRSGPHLLNLLPSFYDDRQYLGFLLFGEGEVLGEIIYNVIGAASDRRCLGRGRLLRSSFAGECNPGRHQDQQEYPFHRFLPNAGRDA
jgi:hypothetical protein